MNKHKAKTTRNARNHQETVTLFKQQVNISLGMLFLVVAGTVLGGFMYTIHGLSFASFLPGLAANSMPSILLGINLFIFAVIGKDKGIDNAIMSFILGICTIPICGLMIAGTVLAMPDYLVALGHDIQGIFTTPVNILDAILRVSMIGTQVATILLAITHIMHDARIIKQNKPTKISLDSCSVEGKHGSPAMTEIHVTTKPCSGCGASIDNSAKFCTKCGIKVA
ncbi:MAG: zinc ribbon domain-containing protein [Candidatus Lokiarchaeota archaeon]|nr:zinc ribbon domain-containing protein [Candidatus Lokiarchaeota archaeon]